MHYRAKLLTASLGESVNCIIWVRLFSVLLDEAINCIIGRDC